MPTGIPFYEALQALVKKMPVQSTLKFILKDGTTISVERIAKLEDDAILVDAYAEGNQKKRQRVPHKSIAGLLYEWPPYSDLSKSPTDPMVNS